MVKKRSEKEREIQETPKSEIKEKQPSSFSKQKSFIISGAAVIIIAILILLVYGGVSKATAGKKAVDFLNGYFLQNEMPSGAELKDVKKLSGLYEVSMDYEGDVIIVYVTKDGKYIMPESALVPISETQPSGTEQATNVPKSDKPKVELFVMSHCPYGTQSEKGILPVAKLLKDKIDFEVKFVYYSMHGETEIKEQTKQYCIQKEQNDKFLDYLSCFLKEGKTDECLNESKIDTKKMDDCVSNADEEFEITKNLEDQSLWLNGRYPLFNVYKEDNEKYNIGGSPTLVINGVGSNAGRDSASYLNAICGSFNDMPEECNQELSSIAPSAGFGYSEGSGSSGGSCG